MDVKVGDKVKFINEKLDGEVIKVTSNSLLIACSDGFDHEVTTSEVIVVKANNDIHYTPNNDLIKDKVKKVKLNQTIPNSFISRYTATTKYQFEKVAEIDLHLEELVEFPNKLDDWQKLHTQLQHVKKCISAAQEANVRRLVFIHGKGTGVLKAELQSLLSNYDDLSFKDADFRDYGGGATEVYIK